MRSPVSIARRGVALLRTNEICRDARRSQSFCQHQPRIEKSRSTCSISPSQTGGTQPEPDRRREDTVSRTFHHDLAAAVGDQSRTCSPRGRRTIGITLEQHVCFALSGQRTAEPGSRPWHRSFLAAEQVSCQLAQTCCGMALQKMCCCCVSSNSSPSCPCASKR